jgi:hypothetical protein
VSESGAGLYQRLLAQDFDRLPASLRRFHRTSAGAAATGELHVTRAAGPAARALALIFRLPPAGECVPVLLRVSIDGETELWERVIGTRLLRSRQWIEGRRLVERVGVLTFAFDVAADERGMRLRSVGCRLLGMPLPSRVAPCVDADVAGGDAHWDLTVVVRAPIVGLVTSYYGRVEPTS